MPTKINTGSQSTCAAASSLTTNSPSATAGNKLVLTISWLISADPGSAFAPGSISGWTLDVGPTSSRKVGTGLAGDAVYSKTAAGGVESPVFNSPDGTSNLFAHGIITEWQPSGTWSFDSTASSSAILTNNTGGASTGDTIPNTGTLAQANSAIISVFSLMATTGLANANFAFSGGSWTTDATDNDTSASVGTIIGDKVVSSTSPVNAVLTWTSDSTIACYQGAIGVYGDTGGAASGTSVAWWKA